MRNLVTGKIHRAIIELPTGFESNKLEMSSLKNMFAEDGFLNFSYADTHMEVSSMLNGRNHGIATEPSIPLKIYTTLLIKRIYLDSCTTSPSATTKVG
jgi:hypothetical protein